MVTIKYKVMDSQELLLMEWAEIMSFILQCD